MSGNARFRGQRGRGRAADGSDTRSRRDDTGLLQPPPPGGTFDGPASQGRGSASGAASTGRGSNVPSAGGQSPAVSQSGSQTGSRRESVSAPTALAQPRLGDPARDGPAPRYTDSLRNIDLPASSYNVDNLYQLPTDFKLRPGFNQSGKAVQLAINSYPVTQFPTVRVFQYDVTIGNGAETRGVQRKVWSSKARIEKTGSKILFDGNKLAWSTTEFPEIRVMVDLDAEDGRQSTRKDNTFRLAIKRTRALDPSIIQNFLDGQIQMSTAVLESINFLDHLLREGPAINPRFHAVKRSFFIRDGQRSTLGGNVEVMRGVYQSIRLAEGRRMIINLDVANTCFYQPVSLTAGIMAQFNLRDIQGIVNACRPVQDNGHRKLSVMAKQMEKKFRKVNVKAKYKGCPTPDKVWNIKSFLVETPRDRIIDIKDKSTKQVTKRQSIFDYFREKYNITLQYPQLPLIEMTKKGVLYPMELLHVVENQRYPFKLDEKQTANMIKFAVSPPAVRLAAINEGKSWLNWSEDKVCQEFKLKVDGNAIHTNARLLPAPGVKFGNNKIENPGVKGRWDLRGKKFLLPNPIELAAWGVGVFPGRIKADKGQIDHFVNGFIKAYREHGGKVANPPPLTMQLPADPGLAVETLHQTTGNKFQRRPQLLVFLVQDKNSFHYTRVKKSSDCRYGVVSQVMQLSQVLKGNPQYYSNVLMKVNAKLGGCTSQAIPDKMSGVKPFNAPTMFIGADVSHASPGSPQASMAALTVSFDRHAGRYAAACQTNGHRVEIISEANFRSMLGPLITQWQSQVSGGNPPAQVYYMRDGVSEGQFIHVMQQEIPHIRAVLTQAMGQPGKPWGGKLTVVIASKRHHIRAFPQQGTAASDPKGNPNPGVLIEHDCTSPNEWDFFLYSHVALQGTSRPVHYTILYDEANHQPSFIQNMIYEHCYQYMRSTTSVSLHPAVYYAHLASNRARAHEDIPASEGPQGGPGYKQNAPPSSDPPESETKPLVPMFNANGISFAMWYI